MTDSTLAYIRRYYQVPAYKDVRVKTPYGEGVIARGTSDSTYILVRMDEGKPKLQVFHPRDKITYLLPEIKTEILTEE